LFSLSILANSKKDVTAAIKSQDICQHEITNGSKRNKNPKNKTRKVLWKGPQSPFSPVKLSAQTWLAAQKKKNTKKER